MYAGHVTVLQKKNMKTMGSLSLYTDEAFNNAGFLKGDTLNRVAILRMCQDTGKIKKYQFS